MYVDTGTTLYRYTIRRGKFNVAKGVVAEQANRRKVIFGDDNKMVGCPRVTDIGVIRHNGPTLWLDERDDELAMEIFIDFEKRQINRYRTIINKKTKVVAMLEENLREELEGLK